MLGFLIAAASAVLSGNGLLDMCRQKSPVCTAYVVGYSGVMDADVQAGGARTFCRPDSVSDQQLGEIAARWLALHPERRHAPASTAVGQALGESFPCQAGRQGKARKR